MFGENPFGSAAFGDGPLSDPPASIPEASLRLGLRITVVEEEAPKTLGLNIIVTEAASVSLATRISVVEAQDLTLPLDLSIKDPIEESPPSWRPVVYLDGVDISAKLTGLISVEAYEGEARLSTFQIVPSPGSLILPDWTGKRVEIDFAEQNNDGSATNATRLFTGVVNIPDYSFSEKLVTFDCTDLYQQVVKNTPRVWFDENVQGFYSEAVNGEIRNTLQYADVLMLSVPKSLDLDPFQQVRVTDWQLEGDPDFVFDENQIWDESLSIKFAERSDIVNEIETGLKFRYPKLRGRVAALNFERTINQYTSQGLDIPNREMIAQAISSISGWKTRGEINYVPVDPGQYESSGSGGTIFTSISVTDAPLLALGFAVGLTTRWVQWITEDYRLTTKSESSISAIGRSPIVNDSAVLDVEFDDGQWLADESVEPVLTMPISGDVTLDFFPDSKSNRSAAENTIKTLIAQSRTKILSSHRKTIVSFTTPLLPSLDLDKKVEISTDEISATGKVVYVKHTMNLETGEADSEVQIAISGFSALGMDDDDEIEPPTPPTDPTPGPSAFDLVCICDMYIGQVSGAPEFDEETMIGFSTNARAGDDVDVEAPAYPYALSVKTPEVPASVRDPKTLEKTKTSSVAIPQDTLEFTA
jgi:hypothetical protein